MRNAPMQAKIHIDPRSLSNIMSAQIPCFPRDRPSTGPCERSSSDFAAAENSCPTCFSWCMTIFSRSSARFPSVARQFCCDTFVLNAALSAKCA
jgi:hypothetical protein